MKNIFIKVFLFVNVLFVFGCGDDDFKKYYTLEDTFRVLGIKADTPEISTTGGTITLTPYVSDYVGGGRNISVSIVGCLDPGIAYGAEIDCVNESTKQTVTYNSGNSVNISTDLQAGSEMNTGAMPNVSITIPSELISDRSALEQFNGIDYLVIFTFSISGENDVMVIKRIKISSNSSKNSNPAISANSITFEGQSPTLTSNSVVLGLSTDSGAEIFNQYSYNGNLETTTETIYQSWFVSSGTITGSQGEITDSISYKMTDPLPSEALILVVVRDARGGEDIQWIKIN